MNSARTNLELVHVTTVHRALDTRIYYREARSAQKAGLNVAVIGPHDKFETIDGVEIVPIKKYKSSLVRRLFSPILAFREIVRLQPKIVHFHDPEFIPAAAVLKFLGYQVVWDIHEYYSEVQTAHLKKGPFRAVKRTFVSLLVEKGPCAFFDRSVFPTNALRRAIWPTKNSIACVNLLPIDEFPDEGDNAEKVYDLVFMGSMSPFRAWPFMVMVSKLRRKRPDFKAVLLGVSDSTKEWMLNNLPSPDTLNALVFLQRVPHSQVSSLLRKSRIGFNYHPMQKRFRVALPMKVYEYMACKIPVVCSRFPELSEQFSDEEMVFVEGDFEDDYVNAIDSLLSNPEKMELIGRLGNLAVRERLNWERSEAPKLVAMYRELLQ